MITIYCIEDINDMKYVGSTKLPLNTRFTSHKAKKKSAIWGRAIGCSSSKLHLEHSVIYEIERCHENERKDRERYWINKTECVNERKLNTDNEKYKKEYRKQYHQRNKDRLCRKQRECRIMNRIYKFLKILEEY